MPLTYQYITLGQAQADLSSRLYDSTQQLWPPAELTLYLRDTLRTWNSLTNFQRADMVINLQPGLTWYDLTAQPGTIRPYTVQDNEILQLIEYGLLEPVTPNYPLIWTGSLQFSLNDILSAITRKQNEILGTAACTLTPVLIDAPIRSGTMYPPDTTLVIRRVVWNPVPGQGFTLAILKQSDDWAENFYSRGFTTQPQQPPRNWRQSVQQSPGFAVDAVPPVPGVYEVLSSLSGETSNTSAPSLMQVPDDWTWVIRWGALADLLSRESNSRDTPRAEYAARRFREGLGLMAESPAVLALRLNNVPMGLDSVRNGDDFAFGWQGAVAATPRTGYCAGLNLVGFAPVDTPAGGYSVTASVVQNAPVPSLVTDYLQVSRDDYDSILDYAQHLAMFKIPGIFQESIALYARFLRRAALYNAKLTESGFYVRDELEGSRLEDERSPQYAQQPMEILK